LHIPPQPLDEFQLYLLKVVGLNASYRTGKSTALLDENSFCCTGTKLAHFTQLQITPQPVHGFQFRGLQVVGLDASYAIA